MEMKGQFAYYKTAKGYFNYRLKSFNKITIAVSGGTGYSSLASLKAGVESVRKNATVHVDDLTLKDRKEALKFPKFEIYQDKAGEYRFRLTLPTANFSAYRKTATLLKIRAKRVFRALRNGRRPPTSSRKKINPYSAEYFTDRFIKYVFVNRKSYFIN